MIEHRAPLTLALLVEVNLILSSRNTTREEFRIELNKHLPEARQIPATHAGVVKLSHWLNPTGPEWSEPRSEIILAINLWLQNHIVYKPAGI